MTRTIQTNTPRGRALCETCKKPLNYEYGSVAWSAVDHDLCGGCSVVFSSFVADGLQRAMPTSMPKQRQPRRNVQILRPVHDLRRDEVELLTQLPYDKPGTLFVAEHRKIGRRMLRGGFLEADPMSSRVHPTVRCTERGQEAVDYFRRRGWLK